MKALATGSSESLKLMAKGASDARLIIAEKTVESLKVVGEAMKNISNDPTQYMIGLQYIKMLKTVCKNAAVEVYMPLQMNVGGATSRLNMQSFVELWSLFCILGLFVENTCLEREFSKSGNRSQFH